MQTGSLSNVIQFGKDSRSQWVLIHRVPCKRKAYPLQFGYGSNWIRSRVNGALKDKSGVGIMVGYSRDYAVVNGV